MEVKRDPYVLGLAAVCVVCATFLLLKHVVAWETLAGFFTGFLLPSIFGRSHETPPSP